MALKKSVLSWLFGSKSAEKKAEDEGEPADAQVVQAEDEKREEELQEPEEQQEPEADVPAPRDPACLDLSSDHVIHELWRLRKEEEKLMPVPVLRLEGTGDKREILTEEELGSELARLKQFVTDTAGKRLDYIKKETEKLQRTESSGDEAEEQPEEAPEELQEELDLDAEAHVFLTKDKIHAWLLVYPPMGQGKDVDSALLEQTLEEAGVCFGVQEELVDQIPESPERYFHLFFAACGEYPVDGENGRVEDYFSRGSEREAIINEYDKVDYTQLNFVHNVEKGDVICGIFPPTPGEPGRTVLDEELRARDGKAAQIPMGKNTEMSEDGERLVASIAGQVDFSGQKFVVMPVLEISGNVDYSTGNIDFVGDVHIRGDVCSGFVVRASGNVSVDGVLEACTIEAGGDVLVVKGVKGDDAAVIHAGRNVYAKYLESSFVYAREHLHSDCIINCDVYSDGVVQAVTGRGIIIGGTIRAGSEVRANIVGSRSECITSVQLGGIPCEVYDREHLIKEIEEAEAEVKKLERQLDNPVKLNKLPVLHMRLSVDRSKLHHINRQLGLTTESEEEEFQKQFLEERLRELMGKSAPEEAEGQEEKDEKEDTKEEEQEQDSRRLVCGTAYPGTEISIGNAVLRLDRETRECTAVLIRGEIRLLQ